MSLIKVDYGNIGGGELNPTSFANGVISSGRSADCTIDVTKTYIVSISANYTSSGYYLDTYMIKEGVSSVIYDATLMASSLSVSGTTATITNSSGANACYEVVQLD